MPVARIQALSLPSLLAAILLTSAGCDEKNPKAVTLPPPTVEASQPIERTVTDFQVFTARTQAVQSVEIKARVTGYLTKILFKDGADVNKDEVLFQIDDRPYKATLDQNTAALETAAAALVKAQAEYDIGLGVAKSDAGAISKQQLAARLGSRDEAKANVDVNRAAVESAKLNYEWCKVTSPLTGKINTHFVDVGNLVSQNVTTLTNIVSYRPTWAYFDVDENTLLKLQSVAAGTDSSAEKTVVPVSMGLANSKAYPFQGTIDFVSNQVDPNTGSIRVRAVFPNEDGKMLAGLFGRLRMPIGKPHSALLVSDRAIGTDQGQSFVLVVNDKDEVEYRAVEIGKLHDGLREVYRTRTITESDPTGKQTSKDVDVLKATDRIIVDGLQRVRPGVKVEPRMVDMQTLMAEPAAKAK